MKVSLLIWENRYTPSTEYIKRTNKSNNKTLITALIENTIVYNRAFRPFRFFINLKSLDTLKTRNTLASYGPTFKNFYPFPVSTKFNKISAIDTIITKKSN